MRQAELERLIPTVKVDKWELIKRWRSAMIEINNICGECKFHRLETKSSPNKKGQITCSAQVRSGWICVNSESDYFTDFTDYTDTCECFEERGRE